VKNQRGDRETRGLGDKSYPRVSASQRHVPLITLLTDFGTADYFVAAVKGVILGLNAQARMVDITHDIPPQDIESAAYTLLAAYTAFPAGTIHVAVVDPGVGSARRAIVIELGEQFFVGPDNGLFSFVCDSRADESFKAFALTNEKYFRHPVSSTFNGRDVFAPVAAALSLGVKPKELGPAITDLVRLPSLKITAVAGGNLQARIIHIDRFGNCITNITPNDLPAKRIDAGVTLRVKGKLVKSFKTHFAEQSTTHERLFAIWGSAGFLELAAANASAAKLLQARRGDPVIVMK
jgi:S-adenosylmethionine hydrolase